MGVTVLWGGRGLSTSRRQGASWWGRCSLQAQAAASDCGEEHSFPDVLTGWIPTAQPYIPKVDRVPSRGCRGQGKGTLDGGVRFM